MRSLAITAAVAATVFVATPAGAADMARPVYKASPAPIATYNWTGFYIGGNAGAGWAHADVVTTNAPGEPGPIFGLPANLAAMNTAGTGILDRETTFIGGGQLGYNWQAGNWLVGAEADFNYFDQTATRSAAANTTIGALNITNSVSTDWLATFRGRLGLTFDRWLVYATGGAALTDMSYTQRARGDLDNAGATFGLSEVSDTKWGWTVGGGLEYALGNGWSVKGEYLFARFSGMSTTTIVRGSTTTNTQILTGSTSDLDMHVARGGLNFKF